MHIDDPHWQILTPLNLWKANDEKFIEGLHHWWIDYHFRQFVYEPNDEDILIVTAPPRHGKSTYLSNWAPAHYLGRRPDHHVILCSYGSSIAKFHSKNARDLFHRTAPLFSRGLGVNRLSSAAHDWQTNRGGGMLSSGVTGPVTGRGGDLILIDDYMKSAKDAMSPSVRKSQWEWFTATVSTRREPGAKIVILATPWHREDLIGKIEELKDDLDLKVRIVRLPALCEDPQTDILGRQEGEALWENRWPRTALLKQKRLMGPYWWQAQYMGNPGLRGEAEWPEEYFEGIYCDKLPDGILLDALTLDPSKGKTDRSDFQAMVYVGYHRGTLYVDARIDREPVPRMLRQFARLAKKFHPVSIGIETNQFQELLVEEFRQACDELDYVRDDEVTQLENKVNKFVRILRLGPYLYRKNIKIVKNAGGKKLVQQLQDFPNGDHDDGPDALEMALRCLAGIAGFAHGDVEDLILTTEGAVM